MLSFLQIVLPCEDNFLRNCTLDRPSYCVGRHESLPCDIEHALLDILEKEIDLQRRLRSLIGDLHIRYDYSTLAAYRSIDKYNDGRIDNFNLGSFLRSCGHYAAERELIAIIRRIDTDGDSRLSYAEFSEFLRGPAGCVSQSVRASSPAPRQSRNLSMSGRARQASPRTPATRRYVYTSPAPRYPVRYSPVRYSPVRYVSPMRASSPMRVSPVRYVPVPEPLPYATKPVLDLHTEDTLVHALRDIIQQERELESTKVTLALKHDFNLHDAFHIFDNCHSGSVGVHDLRDGLSAIGVHATIDEINLFLSRYDKSGSRRLTFTEFAEAFKAHDAHYAHTVNARPSNYRGYVHRRDDVFSPSTAIEFRNMWRVHFKTENAAESVRQQLERQPFFNVYDAFNSVDLNDDGAITDDEIKRIVESRGFYVTHKDAEQVADKFNKYKSGRVTFSDVSNPNQTQTLYSDVKLLP